MRRLPGVLTAGGFIFNTVHNIQADVPAENFMAMWEALQEYGVYRRVEASGLEKDAAVRRMISLSGVAGL